MSTQTKTRTYHAESDLQPALPAGPAAGPLTQSVLFHRDPLRFLRTAQERYGNVFTVRMAVAGTLVVVADREALHKLVPADPGAARTGEARRRVVQILPEQGVLGTDGDLHQAARSRLAPAFTREALERRRTPMAEIAERHVADWPTGRPFRVLPRMRGLLDEVLTRVVFGVRDEMRARALAAAIWRMLWTPGNPPVPPPAKGAGLAGELGQRLWDRRRSPVERLLAMELDARRAADDLEGDDAIGCLLRAEPPLDTREAVDQLMSLVLAGHESNSAGHIWVLDRLSREPKLCDAFAATPPANAGADPAVREALRLRPAVHSVMRRLTTPVQISGHQLAAGTVTMVPILLLHRDPEAFPDPDSFRPERFKSEPMGDAPYFPFGGGARRCLGEPLAQIELATVLPAVLRRLRLRPLWPEPERPVVRGTVLVPHRSELALAANRPTP